MATAMKTWSSGVMLKGSEKKSMELFRRLEQVPELSKFDGATIDYHLDRPAAVFIPWIPLIAEVQNGELPRFLRDHGVHRVLVDALWPGNAGVLKELIDNGVEVYVLRRPSALHGWWRRGNNGRPKGLVEWLMRRHPEVLRGFKEGIKNDIYDAVLLRYVKPKFMMRVTREFLECWVEMLLWRVARKGHRVLRQQIAVLPIPEEEKGRRLRLSEELLLMHARKFVDTMRKFYPVDELFEEGLRINEDVVSKAYACELFLEMDESKGLRKNLNKAALRRYRSKNGTRFIHDGAMTDAATQLTLRLWGEGVPKTKEEKVKFSRARREVVEKIWNFKRRALSRGGLGGGSP